MAKKLYKSFSGPCRAIMPNGKEILFTNGRHATDSADVMAYLDQEIATGITPFYVDPAEPEEVTAEEVVADLKAQAIAEFLAANPQLQLALEQEKASAPEAAPAEEPKEETQEGRSGFQGSISTTASTGIKLGSAASNSQ